MAINKIEFDSHVLIDLTGDTVTAQTLASGVVAHDRNGNQITGEFETTNGSVIQDDDGYVVLNDEDGSGINFIPLNVTQNGTYSAPSNAGYTPVTVSVNTVPTLQSKTATPTESVQTIVADSGYDGLSSVQVGAIESTYVGTGVSRKSASDLVASGSFVNVVAGYYSSGVSKAVNAGSASVPATNLAFAPAISIDTATGVITASVSGSSNISPTITSGYVNSGVSGKISVTGSNSLSLAIQAAKTLTPTTASQLAVASGRYTTGSVYVDAIPSAYVIPSGTLSISASGVFDVASYASANVAVSGNDGFPSSFVKYYIEDNRFLMSNADDYVKFIDIVNNVSQIGSCALAGAYINYSNLYIDNTLAFNSCSKVCTSAFAYAKTSYSKKLVFPICTTVMSDAFRSTAASCELVFSTLSLPDNNAFAFCSASYISAPNINKVPTGCFSSCKLLTADFPLCSIVNQQGFANCTNLKTVSLPNCSEFMNAAFSGCTKLESVYAPSCSLIADYCFSRCSMLSTLTMQGVLSIGTCAFQNCSQLQSVDFPLCETIQLSAFVGCTGLSNVNFANCVSVFGYAFSGCSALESALFDSCEKIGAYAFLNCISLSVASFPNCSIISSYAFSGCRKLESIYFTGDSVPSIVNNIFLNTPISSSALLGYFGSIYVASSMLESFKADAIWSIYSSRIVGI